jgi:uncharacterized protein (DUF362 family)
MTSRSKVAVLFTQPETVLQDYDRLLTLAGMQDALDPKATTILKDNISWHYPFPSANTTPWQLEGTILALRKAGYTDLSCVQNETVVINTFKGEDLNLFSPIFRGYCIPVLYNFKDGDMDWIPYEPKGEMLVLHDIYPEGIHIPDYFFGKNIVHLPTVKCHIYTTTTGAMKNAFGGLLHTRRHYTHSWIHQTLVDLLTIQQEIHPGVFAVMDGTTAGNGPGPRTMTPEVKNVILASADQVAIDAVAAKLMGMDPLSIDYIRLAHERGLGVGDVRELELVGDDVSGENWHFEVGQSFHKFLGWLGWYGPTKVLQRLVFRTPLVKIPIFISEFNHDYVHWPLKERGIYQRWRETTAWGQLFAKYEAEGCLGVGAATRGTEHQPCADPASS